MIYDTRPQAPPQDVFRIPARSRGAPDTADFIRTIGMPGTQLRLSDLKPPSEEMLVLTEDNVYYGRRTDLDNSVVDLDLLRKGDPTQAIIPTWTLLFPMLIIGQAWKVPRADSSLANEVNHSTSLLTAPVRRALVRQEPANPDVDIPDLAWLPVSPFVATEGIRKIVDGYRKFPNRPIDPKKAKRAGREAMRILNDFFFW